MTMTGLRIIRNFNYNLPERQTVSFNPNCPSDAAGGVVGHEPKNLG